jgi:hypothetical protein
MLNDLDVVVLLQDRPDQNVRAGYIGTIVHVHTPTEFMVEFSDDDGQTFEMADLRASELLKIVPVPRVTYDEKDEVAAA